LFTGIIESTAHLVSTRQEGTNLHLRFRTPISRELKVDQSVAHNGVCLTVTKVEGEEYEVTAVEETLTRTNLGELEKGDLVNLERCMRLGDRLDGHIVQGHVDTRGRVERIDARDGSWNIYFSYDPAGGHPTVPKGSVCVNGVSLTVVESGAGHFSVTIIPYTWEHTNFHQLQPGSTVNLEFDIIGKYVERLLAERM
jgi:riboflavin synthase